MQTSTFQRYGLRSSRPQRGHRRTHIGPPKIKPHTSQTGVGLGRANYGESCFLGVLLRPRTNYLTQLQPFFVSKVCVLCFVASKTTHYDVVKNIRLVIVLSVKIGGIAALSLRPKLRPPNRLPTIMTCDDCGKKKKLFVCYTNLVSSSPDKSII